MPKRIIYFDKNGFPSGSAKIYDKDEELPLSGRGALIIALIGIIVMLLIAKADLSFLDKWWFGLFGL